MKPAHFPNEIIAQKFQVVFSIFLVVTAFLFRENANLIYPQILYLLLSMLALNFAAGFSLRLWPTREWITTSIILGNCAVVTAIISYSGGQESNLWVLYLLPIYTVCLLLNGREAAWITAGIVGFNAAFHVVSAPGWNAATFFELAIKTGILILAGGVTWNVVSTERKARKEFEAKRREIKRLSDKMEYQESHFEQAGKLAELGQAASGVAHDLNSPLMVILGTVEIALQEKDSQPQMKEDLSRIRNAALLCKDIVANILGYIRKNDGERTRCRVNSVVESVIALYGSELAKMGIQVRTELENEMPAIKVNIPQMQRVLLNLMSNAAAAMKQRGTLTIRTEACSTGSEIPGARIVVEDTGPGIPEVMMETLFHPFRTTKAPGEGTGLGLYISKEIILKHGGSLLAEKTPEGGARLVVRLPSAEMDRAKEPQAISG